MKKLGFRCMRLPVLGESKDFMSAENIDLEQFRQMVDIFMERCFTYFDTSYVYHGGKSELALREALVKRYPRDSFLLADKLPTFSITKPEQLSAIFEEQLERHAGTSAGACTIRNGEDAAEYDTCFLGGSICCWS